MAASYYGTLSEFDCKRELWVNYKERLEFFYTANEIEDEDKKKAILLSTSGPETYALFRNLCAPDNPLTKTYAQLKQLMQEHLQPTPNPIAERFKFNSRTRQPNENVSDYVAALRQLSIHCDYGNTVTTMLRDRLVCGINSHRIQQKLLTEGSTLIFTSAFRLAVSIEGSERNAMEIQSRNSHTHASSHAGSHGDIHHVERNAGDSDKVCYRCGRTGHRPDKCYFKERDCYSCHVRGHTSKVCRKKKQDSKNRVKIMEQVVGKADEDNCSEEDVYNIYPVTEKRVPPLIVDIHIASKNISMEIDTGASLTVMGKHNYDKLFANNGIKLTPFKGTIKTYTGEVIQPIGVMETGVEYNNKKEKLPLVILEGNGPSLLGRNWLNILMADWNHIFGVNNLNNSKQATVQSKLLDAILNKYGEVFEDKTGTLKDTLVHIKMKKDATPRFHKARQIPYALKNRVDKELDRLVQEGVYKPVEISEWAAPIVPVIKKDGSIRLCGDYKVTVNRESICDNYPIPRTEDLFAMLSGGEKFTKLDLRNAYQQLLLDEESRKVLTVNTHRGLFEPLRLQFGIHSATGIFQREMEKRLSHIPFTTVRVDDILISGSNDETHLENLSNVLEVLSKNTLKLKRSKCVFLAPEVTYLGYKISKDGVTTIEEKILPILKAPAPENVTQLKSFLGMLNYYHRHLPNIASVLEPLHALLRKGVPWKWSNDQSNSFEKAKKLLCSPEVLVHYDPEKPVIVHCDASPYGIGAVISHVMPGHEFERPIGYASRSLNSAERNYSQIEREALAIVYAIKKFHPISTAAILC